MQIKGTPINVIKTSVMVDPSTFYGFWFITDGDTLWRKILRFSIKSFYPQYPAKKTVQEYLIELVFQQLDGQSAVISENVLDSSIGSYDVVGERFYFFQNLSEIGSLRVPEHLINGLLNKITETVSLFGSNNPVWVSRQYVDGNYAIEAYSQEYLERQALVCWIGTVAQSNFEPQSEPPIPLNDGSIELLFSEATNPTASIDGSALAPVTSPHTFSGLAPGEHTIVVKDDVQEVVFTVNT